LLYLHIRHASVANVNAFGWFRERGARACVQLHASFSHLVTLNLLFITLSRKSIE